MTLEEKINLIRQNNVKAEVMLSLGYSLNSNGEESSSPKAVTIDLIDIINELNKRLADWEYHRPMIVDLVKTAQDRSQALELKLSGEILKKLTEQLKKLPTNAELKKEKI